jgi:aminomethyltransferase
MTANSDQDLRRTPLYGLHIALGGKMVPFAGYELPVHYEPGILREHLHTRAKAGLFDVSHMGQATLSGSDSAAALEMLTPADVKGLKEGQQRYALLLNAHGGINDDFMVARLAGEDTLHLVVNGATKEGDFAYISETLRGRAELVPHPERALLALQGPAAEAVLSRHAPEAASLGFMKIARMNVAGVPAIVSRSGYTGEDGYEISIPGKDAAHVAHAILEEPEVMPIGLGARDSLRLEAGLCLYGHDLDEDIDPVSANLVWSIGKRRRSEGGFPAAEKILGLIANGAKQKRIGIKPEGRAPAREGTVITDKSGRSIGRITSGGFGPSANAPVAMGYVDTEFSADGTEIDLLVRGRPMPARVAPMPFVPHRYKRSEVAGKVG